MLLVSQTREKGTEIVACLPHRQRQPHKRAAKQAGLVVPRASGENFWCLNGIMRGSDGSVMYIFTRSLDVSPPHLPAMPPKDCAVAPAWNRHMFNTVAAYVELTRIHLWPLGSNVVFWPCAYGLLMASMNTSPQISVRELCIETVLYAGVATIMHSKACILNDICDMKFDGKVERTKNRPLVSGRVSLGGAWTLLFVLLLLGLSALTYISSKAVYWTAFGILTLNAAYPLMKRYTWWPQLFLGLAINWGLLVAWLSTEDKSAGLRPLYAISENFSWTIYYDSIYACQDKGDDTKAGVKSTALLFGSHLKLTLRAFAITFICLMALAGVLNGNSAWFYVVSCGGAACHILWQQCTWKEHDTSDCAAKFKVQCPFLTIHLWCLNVFSPMEIWVLSFGSDYYWITYREAVIHRLSPLEDPVF
ncbi:hypothetical protein NM688_g45 [Phlebia brevispora]|uniref:Uncharacterized protein n=1 Tax=Phlebia brevispora TaxID=194682 RepID=A0ACC1TG71_9APHY|nr:hypothetical protein NM688_g45 [Phlebia brevispora]